MATFREIEVGSTFRFPRSGREFMDDFGVCRKVARMAYLYGWQGRWHVTKVGSSRVDVQPVSDDGSVPKE